jgi:hypothetical protein
MSNLKKAHKRGMITGLKDVTFDKSKLCSACQFGKQVVIHHPLKIMLSTSKPLDLLHMDLFGATSYKSIGGNVYCLVIVNDYSRYTWTLFLGDRMDTTVRVAEGTQLQDLTKVKAAKVKRLWWAVLMEEWQPQPRDTTVDARFWIVLQASFYESYRR